VRAAAYHGPSTGAIVSAARSVTRPGRVLIEGVVPEVDCGRFPIKRVIGATVEVAADIFAEGHDRLAAVLRFRITGAAWQEVTMQPLANDRWQGQFTVTQLGEYEYTIVAWVDDFASWRSGLLKKVEAQQAVTSGLLEGAELIRAAAARATGLDHDWLIAQASSVGGSGEPAMRVALSRSPELEACIGRYPDRACASTYRHNLSVQVEPERAGFGAWYEMFPRSCASSPGRHGTFKDCAARVPYVASMGFDVLYLPPIHPIGVTHRKGADNTPDAGPNDPGSPWAIGAADGGHTAVHPALGNLDDFDNLVATAGAHGLEIALDLAFQCSPDHPYVREHPEWFRRRPDGTVQYAENPPKAYQDIYPLNFETTDWQALWDELKRVVLFWISHGVSIFLVDNPHTKPFAFWEWLIREVRRAHPAAIFLAEAFTRPKVMRALAKSGFSQSYTYFTWRNTKAEITEYFSELMQTETREYMRPNLFANTPDILPEYLQVGGRAAFQARLVLAATLAGSYGIYGPAFELSEARAVPGGEEYVESEKYQLRRWDLERPYTLQPLIARVNTIRRDNPALRHDARLRFCAVDNDQLIAYTKTTPDLTNILLIVVNLDPHHAHSGWVEVPLEQLGLDPAQPYQVHELLGDARYLWHGPRNFVAIDPQAAPAHILRVRHRVRTERDFDYFM